MSRYYWHCEKCNGNFDPDENCDCGKDNKVKLKDSITLLLGVDISNDPSKDPSCITVEKIYGSKKRVFLKTIYGKEAEAIYSLLSTGGNIDDNR